MIVHFWNVGRHRHSWTASLPNPSLRDIAVEAKKGGILTFCLVEARLTSDCRKGIIVADLWNTVGSFTLDSDHN